MDKPSPPVLDCHVHLAGHGMFGSFLSPRFRRSIPFRYLLWKMGLAGIQGDREMSEAYLRRIIEQLDQADGLDGVVLLAFDGRYDDKGDLDRESSPMYISNDYCFDACRRDPRLYPAASINPRRKDALEELVRVAERGAVCVKVLPSTQDFDPAHPRLRTFWRRMAVLKLPLLAHTGKEHTLPVTHQEYGDPERLIPPLEEGVTVIAAHAGTGGMFARRETFPGFARLLERFPNLYGDISGMANLGRGKYLPRLAARSEIHSRLVYGSDYPVPSSPMLFAGYIGLRKALRIARQDDLLSAPLAIARAFGFPPELFTRTAGLLKWPGNTGAARKGSSP